MIKNIRKPADVSAPREPMYSGALPRMDAESRTRPS